MNKFESLCIYLLTGLSLLSDGNVTETTEVLNLKEDPILDADLSKEKREQVYLLTDCGDDGCQSNLRVNGTVPPEIVVGRYGVSKLSLQSLKN